MQKSILIDAYNLALSHGTGIATYARNLSHSLREIGHEVDVLYDVPVGRSWEGSLKEIALFDRTARLVEKRTYYPKVPEILRSLLGYRATDIPISSKVVSEPFNAHMPSFDRLWTVPHIYRTANKKFRTFGLFTNVTIPQPPHVAHWTYSLPIRVNGSKNIYTIHDLVPLRLPYTTEDDKKDYHKLVRAILNKADHIVTVSERSKKDIRDLFGFPEDRITNTYQYVKLPAEALQKSESDVRHEIQAAFGLAHKDYFLFYGAIEPKKNILRLVEAYLYSKAKSRLVIVGKPAWLSRTEMRLLRRYVKSNPERILYVEYLPLRQLLTLIRGAKSVIFPSLYEGFGLPILEAMLLNTPVVSSNQGSIPEVAGKAAILVDPYDVRAISSAITEMDGNAGLREKLSGMGLKQAALFSAERYQTRLTELYARVAGN